MRKKITLDDIASETGLSKYAVSRALAGKSGISEATRDRVLQSARRLGYIKTTNVSKNILLIIPSTDLGDADFWMEVVRGIETAAANGGYAVFIRTFGPDGEPPLLSHPSEVQGIIFVGHKSIRILETMQPSTASILLSYPTQPTAPYDAIHIADWEGGNVLCKQLLDWGYKRFVFCGPLTRPSYRERFRGMQAALQEAGMDFTYVWSDTDEMQNTKLLETKMKNLADSGPASIPTAVMCVTDPIAVSLLWILNQLGEVMSDRFFVTGYNTSLREEMTPPITSVGIDKIEFGEQAFELLMNRIRSPQSSFRRVSIVPKLVLRHTIERLKSLIEPARPGQ